jgi:hypothetical protein
MDGGAGGCKAGASEGEGTERMRAETERWIGAGSAVVVTGGTGAVIVAAGSAGRAWVAVEWSAVVPVAGEGGRVWVHKIPGGE